MGKERIPRSLGEALSLRRSYGAQPRMGGLATEERTGAAILPLDGCEEFTRIDTDGTLVHIGAGCTAAQLSKEKLTPRLLRRCAALCPEEKQERGSLGGAICAGSGEVLAVLETLDAKVTVASECGRRTMPLRNFRRRTGLNLATDELLCEILVPEKDAGVWAYERAEGGLAFAAVIHWERRRLAALSVAFAPGEGKTLRYREFEREMLRLSEREARARKDEFLEAYRRWWPEDCAESRTVLLGRLERFLQENHIEGPSRARRECGI